MAFSLTWLAEVLEEAGLKVAEQPGWRTRGRGPMGTVRGVICHHTAGPAKGIMPSLSLITNGRPDLSGPLAQLGLGRDGTFRATTLLAKCASRYENAPDKYKSTPGYQAPGGRAPASGSRA